MRRSLYRSAIYFAAVCSVFVTACGFSSAFDRRDVFFPVSFVHREHVSASESQELTDRILRRLEQAEGDEADAWRRDDLRIAWSTVLHASRGESHSHFWATYGVLRVSPDQVWPMIVARRKAQLGAAYSQFYDANDVWRRDEGADEVNAVPKKPAHGVEVAEISQQAKGAAA